LNSALPTGKTESDPKRAAATAELVEGDSRISGKTDQIRQLRGHGDKRSKDGRDIGPAIGPESGDRRGRQAQAGRIANHPHGREGQAVGGGNPGNDVGFHVDRGRTRCPVEPLFRRPIGGGLIDTGDIRDACGRQRFPQSVDPGCVGDVPCLVADDAPADQTSARPELRIESASDPEADDSSSPGRNRRIEQAPDMGAIGPASDDHLHAGCARDSRLALQADDDDRSDRDGGTARSEFRVHSPCSTVRVLPLVRLR
jgi:hypothetical protein